ncbi:MAG: terminase small subunit [Oscillospiraceae bacterium]|nr:terminase small subunit [Oscillospiraceae bacterium]
MALNQRQLTFCEEYIKTNNATKAAIAAGYSEKTARIKGSQLLTKINISAYIESRLDEINREQIASTDEVMRFFSSVMRGKEKDQFGLDASLSDRIKAGQEIVKRFYSVKRPEQDDTNARMSKLADLLNAPQPNRNIDDFEDEDGGTDG